MNNADTLEEKFIAWKEEYELAITICIDEHGCDNQTGNPYCIEQCADYLTNA